TILVAGFGVASAQQPGQQPGADRDEQPGAPQQDQRSQGQDQQSRPQARQGEQERDRDQQIAAAGGSQSDKFLSSMEQGYIRTDELERSDLVDAQDEDIGNIAGVVIDGQSGEVAGLLVN